MSDAARPITFEEFRSLVARELQVDEARVVAGASFMEDLLADSIRLVEMMLRLADQGITIPMEEAWNVITVGDAYEVYSRHLSAAGTPPPAEP